MKNKPTEIAALTTRMALTKLAAAGALAQKYMGNARFEWQALAVFLTLANQNKSVQMKDLEKCHALSQAAISRNCARLGDGLTREEPGPGLIKLTEDPLCRRNKLASLTPKGAEFQAALREVFA